MDLPRRDCKSETLNSGSKLQTSLGALAGAGALLSFFLGAGNASSLPTKSGSDSRLFSNQSRHLQV